MPEPEHSGQSCECSAAVANALPAVKETADIVLKADHRAGVTELIREILADDLAQRAPLLRRHEILLGKDEQGADVTLSPFSTSALIVGTSGGGKSTAATGLLDLRRLSDMLSRIQGRIIHKELDRVSPLAVPVMLEIGREQVYGEASDELLAEAAEDLVKEAMSD